MTTEQILILLALILIALDLAVTAGRAAIVNVRLERLLSLGDELGDLIDPVEAYMEKLGRLRTELRICFTLLRFFLVGISIALFIPTGGENIPYGWGAIIIATSGVILAIVESIAEAIVLQSPEIWAVRFAPFIRIFTLLMTPITFIPLLLLRSANGNITESQRVTEDDLMTLLDVGEEDGVLEEDERAMIKSVFQLRDTFAREVMVPRIDLLALNVETSVPEAIDKMLESGFSRVPVYEYRVDKVIGILYIKDLVRHFREENHQKNLRDITRPVYFVPETKKVDDLLQEMQEQRIHIAMVVDEYGGVAGLVTLEDIVEELVGEIQDEYDFAEEILYEKLGDHEYIVAARMDLDDFNALFDTQLPLDEGDTLGGLLYSRIGSIPKGGEIVHNEEVTFTVKQVSGRRIRKVRVQLTPDGQQTESEDAHVNRR